MSVVKTDLVEELKKMVDKHSVFDVLTALEMVCYKTGEHINVHWQDTLIARSWEKDGRAIYSILEKIQN